MATEEPIQDGNDLVVAEDTSAVPAATEDLDLSVGAINDIPSDNASATLSLHLPPPEERVV